MFKVKNVVNIQSKDIDIYEMSFESYRGILKTFFGINDHKYFISNILELIKTQTNITSNDLCKLSITDILIILIEIRALSKGAGLTLRIKSNVDDKHTADADRYISYVKNIYDIQSDLLALNTHSTFQYGDIEIKLQLPRLSEIVKELDVLYFIEWIKIKDTYVQQNDLTIQTFQEFPASFVTFINSKIRDYITRFEDIRYVSVTSEDVTVQTSSLEMNYKFICYFIELLFGDNLIVLHENLFKLSQFAHVDLNYINRLSPGEVDLYIKLLRAAISEQNTQ